VDIDASSFVGCFVNVSRTRSGKVGLPRKELLIYGVIFFIHILGERLDIEIYRNNFIQYLNVLV